MYLYLKIACDPVIWLPKVMGEDKFIHEFTLFQILTYTRASVVISVNLIQYDTDWPNCDWISHKVCDPKFEVCLNG